MIRLYADGLDPLILDDWESGIACTAFDPGWPTARDVVSNRPGGNGTIDETSYFGARAVTAQLAIYGGTAGTRRANLDKLAPFCDPGRRPVVEYQDPTGGVRRQMTLRAQPGTAPLTNPSITEAQVSWVAPSGLIESALLSTEWIAPAADAPGLGFPYSFPVSWPAFTGGPVMAVNGGTLPAEWRAAIFGPVTGPALVNDAAGQRLSFPGLSIAAGDYLLLDSAERTVLLNGVEGSSRYGALDFTESTWWQLGIGASHLQFTAEAFGDSPAVLFAWRDAFLI